MVPITRSAGLWLQKQLHPTPLIQRHAQLANQLLPWVVALFVLSVAGWLLERRAAEPRTVARPALALGSARLQLIVAVLVTVAAVGTLVQIARVGDSGAKAVWTGVLPS